MKPAPRARCRCSGRDGFRRLAYAEWGSPKRRADGRLRARRLAQRPRLRLPWQRDLAERGARVVAPDLPGRGRSDWLSSPTHYTDRAYTRAMAALIARLDVEQVDWVGTSLGGHIGMLLAAEPRIADPAAGAQRLRRARLGARAAPHRRLPARKTGASTRSTRSRRTCARSMHRSAQLTDAQWRHLAEHSVVEDDGGVCASTYDPASRTRFAVPLMLDVVLWHLWESIDCPVLILRGEDSDLLSAATVDEMQRRGRAARAGRVSAVEVPGCGHAPALMDDDQIAVVREFLLPTTRPRQAPGRHAPRIRRQPTGVATP